MPFDPATPSRSVAWVLEASHLDRDRRFGCRLLDVRSRAVAIHGHLPGSACLSVRGDSPRPGELPSHLLPPRDQEFIVLDPGPERSASIAAHLRERGFRVAHCDEPLPESAMRPGPAPGALWRPDPLLEQNLPLLPPPTAGTVLDLGSGSGRDAVFLAMHGYDCLLIDRLDDALDLARSRARHHDVEIRTLVGDLRDVASIPAGPYALVLSIRFLQRPVLANAGDLLSAGGAFVLRAFADPPPALDDPRISPSSGSRRPHRLQYRLSLEELSTLLPAERWTFLHAPRVSAWRDDLWLETIAQVR